MDFWKFSELTEAQLLKEAQTCDLLLFRGTRGGSSLIRSVTRGHFDHVALIVRTDEDGANDFSVIEAVGRLGVTATTWSNLRKEIGVGKFYEKCAYRRLKVARTR